MCVFLCEHACVKPLASGVGTLRGPRCDQNSVGSVQAFSRNTPEEARQTALSTTQENTIAIEERPQDIIPNWGKLKRFDFPDPHSFAKITL